MIDEYMYRLERKNNIKCRLAHGLSSFIGSKINDESTRDECVTLSEKDVSYIVSLLVKIGE